MSMKTLKIQFTSVQAFYSIPKPQKTKTKYHEKTSNIETLANGTTKVKTTFSQIKSLFLRRAQKYETYRAEPAADDELESFKAEFPQSFVSDFR